MKKNTLLLLGLSFLVTAITMLISLSTGGTTLSNYWSDYLYKNTSPSYGECIVIGIDQYAIDELGEWPWSREVLADVIDILNQDPDNQPAAIAIDVIFSGATDEEADDRLIESIAASDNIILACSANFDNQLTLNDDGIYYMDSFQITSMNVPYEELDAYEGHINAMYDTDGVLRHHLFSFEYEDETIYSLPYQTYLLWCEANDVEADFEPYTDSNGFWYVEYSREPGDYYTYSVLDILNGTYDPDLLTDAPVLIGTYEANSMDYFTTSAARSERMYGIGYLANVTDAMIRGVTKLQVTTPFLFFVCVFIFLYTFILLKCKALYGAFVYVALSGLTIYAYYGMYYMLDIVLEPLWLPIGYTLGLVASILYHYLSERKDRKYITNVFSRYVDGNIIKQLLKEDSEVLELGGKECDIAVMFVDIRGFTVLSEKKNPYEVVQLLNKYLTLTSSCIKRYNGVVDKFIGDATMAFWGAPLPCKDAVYKACQAALDMVKESSEIDTDGATFGVGIHYGPAVVGNIGTPDRMDFTAIGDTVNTAQRLESQAPGHMVYISEIVKEELGERAITTPLDEKLELKGKSEPMQVYILEKLC